MLNELKMAEINLKNQRALLQTSVERKKSFRTLFLLINKIMESVEELETNLDGIMMEKLSSSSINSVMKRLLNLISRLEKLEIEVNSLEDDGQLSQSSTRVRKDITCISQSSRRQLESQHWLRFPKVRRKQHDSKEPYHGDIFPPVPPRSAKPSFLPPQEENEPKLLS